MDDTFRRGPLLLISGRANLPLADEIGQRLGNSIDTATIRQFADGELFVRIDKNARGRDVIILQPTNAPAENMVELLLLIDAAKRASAARVTAVVPYFGYGRQDRKDQPRVAIGAKLMANLMVAAGTDRVVSIDFHQHQIQGFFDIPVDHLYAAPVFTRFFREKGLKDLVVVAPDVGSAKMARGYSKRLGATFAIIDKRRSGPNASEVMNVVGDVEGRTCILTDDMVDTGGTIANAVHALKDRGADKVYAVATHALFSGSAAKNLSATPLEEFVVTNTIHIPEERRFPQLTVLSVGGLLADAIRFIHSNESVSALFEIEDNN
ncbi:MAG TPA: ribose-phosphate pyrophosphokinase [Gemmatimonadetes bacterium]|nr:ribose-phosphate pyrophosphokinase [Gemmatimonadota bacterium]|tara:strand:+ start:554 stop:1519 length:966 start_codon:yes stop_codon:yes gene_type:complete